MSSSITTFYVLTTSMVKPDGVQRGLVGQIIARFEQKGYKLLALRLIKPTEALLRSHYEVCVVLTPLFLLPTPSLKPF